MLDARNALYPRSVPFKARNVFTEHSDCERRPYLQARSRVTDVVTKIPFAADPMVASELMASRFFELSPDLLCVAGLDGTFRHLNPVWETLIGVPLGVLYARPLLEFVHPSDRPDTLAAMRRLAAGERVMAFENRYRRGNGLYARLS